MASLQRQEGGVSPRWRIQFSTADGRRATIRLGSGDRELVQEAHQRIERLRTAKRLGLALDASTKTWVNQLDHKLARQLQRYGLVDDTSNAKSDAKPDEVVSSDCLWVAWSLKNGRLDALLRDGMTLAQAGKYAQERRKESLPTVIQLVKNPAILACASGRS